MSLYIVLVNPVTVRPMMAVATMRNPTHLPCLPRRNTQTVSRSEKRKREIARARNRKTPGRLLDMVWNLCTHYPVSTRRDKAAALLRRHATKIARRLLPYLEVGQSASIRPLKTTFATLSGGCLASRMLSKKWCQDANKGPEGSLFIQVLTECCTCDSALISIEILPM